MQTNRRLLLIGFIGPGMLVVPFLVEPIIYRTSGWRIIHTTTEECIWLGCIVSALVFGIVTMAYRRRESSAASRLLALNVCTLLLVLLMTLLVVGFTLSPT